MNKHAYLIMAHNDFDFLKKLLCALDDERNDIYLHIDKKSSNFNLEELKMTLQQSGFYYIKNRMNISWGGDTIVKCELMLLQEAYKKHYAYYHLLSGVDYPIKSQDYIHDYFDRNNGKNFIDYESDELSLEIAKDRIQYKHYFQNCIGNGTSKNAKYFYYLDILMCKYQNIIGYNRVNNCNIILKKGAQWFSITDEMVSYVLKSKNIIKTMFFNGICVDEMFLQTIAYNSKLKDTLVRDCLRYTEWLGGAHPKTLDIDDADKLLTSPALFARKFTSSNNLVDVIERLE